jgi:hypothetical protein
MVIEGLTSRGHIESASIDVTPEWPVQLSTPLSLVCLQESHASRDMCKKLKGCLNIFLLMNHQYREMLTKQ